MRHGKSGGKDLNLKLVRTPDGAINTNQVFTACLGLEYKHRISEQDEGCKKISKILCFRAFQEGT